MKVSRAALVVGLLCTCCAVKPEVLRARDTGAKDLGCAGQQAEAKLAKDTGTWRIYDVRCREQAVRVACSEEQSCQLETALPSAH